MPSAASRVTVFEAVGGRDPQQGGEVAHRHRPGRRQRLHDLLLPGEQAELGQAVAGAGPMQARGLHQRPADAADPGRPHLPG